MSRAKGITPVISIIILLLITVALAGSAWLYISGYMEAFTYKVIDIPTGSVYFDGSNMQLLVRNMGTSTISTSPCSASGNTVTCGDITITREGGGSNPDIRPENASISPGSVVKFRDYNCLAGRIRYVISSPSSTQYIDVNADNNCAGAPAPVCGNSICSPGENCPQDNTSCTDNTCYEPTCVSGCGQILVAQGGNDEGCGSPLMCDGSGTCIECIDSDDCGAGYVCQAGNCMPGFCLTVTECANYTDQGNCTTNPCGVGEVCEWNATLGVCEEAPGECNNDADCLSKGPGFVCNTTNNQCEWTPPIGIPRPEFGIEESYRMYDNPENRNPALNYTQNSEGGYYTHYVDNTSLSCIDSGNNYGSVSKPRCSIPLNLATGSVVEIHGGPYTSATWRLLTANGTSTYPVFVRGINVDNMPVISFYLRVAGSYLILENLDFDGGWLALHGNNPQDFMSIRYSEFQHAIGIWINNARNIVVYNNNIHDNGDWQSPEDVGYNGIELSGEGDTDRIWIVDNHIHHNGADGIQTYRGISKHVYIGRNEMDHNRENAVDLKNGQHVIVSQNKFHGYRIGADSNGDAVRLNDEAYLDEIWVILNDIYDSLIGIETYGTTFPAYIIGNTIHDLVAEDINGTHYSSRGIDGHGAGYVISNTIYDTEYGIEERNARIVNNIVSNASTRHVYGNVEIRNNLLWQNGEAITIRGTASCIDCIEADPQFIDAENNDFHLQPTSPAIDNGTSSGVVQQVFDRFEQLYGIDIRKDIEGRTRPIDGDNNGTAEWDIGAYEHVP